MIAESLKKALLQAAVQGKLTEQLPEDGDARDLLKEIQKEKSRLAKESKIKKEKPLPEIKEEEIPFDIPENWVWVRLGDANVITMGQSPKGSSVGKNAGVEFHQGKIFFTDKYLSDSELRCDKLTKIAQSGSILLCVRAPVGVVNVTNRDICIGRGLAAINPFNTIDREFLFYYLITLKQYLVERSTGSTFKAISQATISKALVPIPPLAEQKRIVQKLEKLLPEIDKLKAEEKKLDNLEKAFPGKIRSSILQAAIQGKLTEQLPEDGDARDLLKEIQKEKARLIREGKIKQQKPLPEITEDEIPFDIPDNWVWVRLGDANVITMGQSPDGSSVGKNAGVEFHQGKIFFTDKYISDSELRCDKPTKIALSGSILLCVRAPVGVVNVTNRDICIGRGLAAIIPFNAIDREFLFYYLITLKQYFVERSTGSTFKAISQATISKALVPIPPLAEQKRIVERLEELLPLCTSLDRASY